MATSTARYIADVKAGDLVTVFEPSRKRESGMEPETIIRQDVVAKVTAKLIFLPGGSRWRRLDGNFAKGLSRRSIRVATEADTAEMNRRRVAHEQEQAAIQAYRAREDVRLATEIVGDGDIERFVSLGVDRLRQIAAWMNEGK